MLRATNATAPLRCEDADADAVIGWWSEWTRCDLNRAGAVDGPPQEVDPIDLVQRGHHLPNEGISVGDVETESDSMRTQSSVMGVEPQHPAPRICEHRGEQ